jgi:CRP-like cAMP-binding protein
VKGMGEGGGEDPMPEPMEQLFPCLVKDLPAKQIERFAERLRPTKVERGERMLAEGAPSDSLRFLVAGRLGVFLGVGRDAVLVGDKRPGDWVGELGFVLPGPASASVQALADSEIASIPHSDVPWLAEKVPAVLGRLLSSIATDLARRVRRSRLAISKKGLEALRALHGVEREEVDCAWVPATPAYGGHPVVDVERLVATLDLVGAFGLRGEDEARAKALREDVRRLSAFMRLQMHLDGEAIVREGDLADGLYVILAGGVHVATKASRGAFPVLTELGPGETFGEIAFFDEGTRSATCTAKGAVVLAVLSPTMVKAALESGEQGVPTGVHLMLWFAEQLVRDARKMNGMLREALSAR